MASFPLPYQLTTYVGVVWKLAVGMLNPIIYVIDKDAQEYQSYNGRLEDTVHDQLPSQLSLTTTLRLWPSNQFLTHQIVLSLNHITPI